MPTIAQVRKFIAANPSEVEIILSDVYKAHCAVFSDFAVFDGGAHHGYHTKRMRVLPRCRKVYAVEADPTTGDGLAADLAKLSPEHGAEIVLIRAALQDDPARTEIPWRSSHSHVGRSSIISQAGTGRETIWEHVEEMEYRDETTVPATTIDTLLAEERGPLPFLKLDLEGADLLALQGGADTMRRLRPVIAFENAREGPSIHGFTLSDVVGYFDRLDYVPVDMSGAVMTEANWFGMFEAYAAPRERADWLAKTLGELSGQRMSA